MSYQMKYEYNEELDKDVLHLPLLSIYTQKRFSDIIINMKGVNVGGKIYNNLRYNYGLHFGPVSNCWKLLHILSIAHDLITADLTVV